jgi:hypothetical protein
MAQMRVPSIFAVILLSTLPMYCQESQTISDFLANLSPERLDSIVESRRAARAELAQQSSTFETPNIAIALRFPNYQIVIGKIIGVQLPDSASLPRTRIRFHVEQVIRGNGQVADFDVESRRVPTPVSQNEDAENFLNNPPTALDKTEPKVGDRYILGIAPGYSDEKLVFVPSVIDLLICRIPIKLRSSPPRNGFWQLRPAPDDPVLHPILQRSMIRPHGFETSPFIG